jgi:hypothetical protein
MNTPLTHNKYAAAEASPEVVEHLESLDDVIFPAIDGDEQALEKVEPVWREAVASLGPEFVQESRNQYLRYARATWEFLRKNAPNQRQRMIALLHIIALLMGVDA